MPEQTSVLERRKSSRHQLSLPWTVSTVMSGHKVSAEMIDISTMGAKIRLPEFAAHRMLIPGTELVWNIDLPSGREISVSVSSKWVHRYPEGYILGVSFVDSNLISKELDRLLQDQD